MRYNELPHHGWEIWLAPSKNWLPANVVGYTYRWSNEIPVAKTIVRDWTELKDGVTYTEEENDSKEKGAE